MENLYNYSRQALLSSFINTLGDYMSLITEEINLEAKVKRATSYVEKLNLERKLSMVRKLRVQEEKRVKHDRT